MHGEVIALKAITTICKVHGGVHAATGLKYSGVDTESLRLIG